MKKVNGKSCGNFRSASHSVNNLKVETTTYIAVLVQFSPAFYSPDIHRIVHIISQEREKPKSEKKPPRGMVNDDFGMSFVREREKWHSTSQKMLWIIQ